MLTETKEFQAVQISLVMRLNKLCTIERVIMAPPSGPGRRGRPRPRPRPRHAAGAAGGAGPRRRGGRGRRPLQLLLALQPALLPTLPQGERGTPAGGCVAPPPPGLIGLGDLGPHPGGPTSPLASPRNTTCQRNPKMVRSGPNAQTPSQVGGGGK